MQVWLSKTLPKNVKNCKINTDISCYLESSESDSSVGSHEGTGAGFVGAWAWACWILFCSSAWSLAEKNKKLSYKPQNFEYTNGHYKIRNKILTEIQLKFFKNDALIRKIQIIRLFSCRWGMILKIC